MPVLDLERLVDFPNEPVSATALRGLAAATGFPSLLFSEKSGKSGMLGAIALGSRRTCTVHKVFGPRPGRYKAHPRSRYEGLVAACRRSVVFADGCDWVAKRGMECCVSNIFRHFGP